MTGPSSIALAPLTPDALREQLTKLVIENLLGSASNAKRTAVFSMAACRNGSPRQGRQGLEQTIRAFSPPARLNGRTGDRVGVWGRDAPNDDVVSVARRGSGAER